MTNPAGDAVAGVRAAVGAALRDPDGASSALVQVGEACAELLPVDGASVSVMAGTDHRETLYVSDAVIATVEELQFTLGEGPCFEAVHHRRPVLVADLAADSAVAWPVFATEISAYPIGAVFAFPLQSGAATFGAIDMYRREPGWLATDELATALQLADLAAMVLLQGLTGVDSVPESEGVMLPPRGEQAHQAAGMLIAEYRISAVDALARLRGYAFATEATVEQVAADLTSRRIVPADLGD